MRDTKWRYLYLRDPIQIQTWLEDLSLEGWQLEKIRGDWGRFRRIPPHRIRYRLEPVKTGGEGLGAGQQEEKDRLYGEMGWRLVGRALSGECCLYCAEDPNAPELHTDPEILEDLWRRLRRRVLWGALVYPLLYLMCLIPLLRQIFWSANRFSPVGMVDVTWGEVVFQVLFLPVVVKICWDKWAMCRPYRQLHRGDREPYRPYDLSRWKKFWVLLGEPLVLFAMVAAIAVPVSGRTWNAPAVGDLQELEHPCYIDVDTVEHRGEPWDESYLERENTFTAVYWSEVWQSCYSPEANWENLVTEYYHMRWRFFARLAVGQLLPEEGAEALDFPGTDGVWTGTEPDTGRTYVIAWRDTQVIRLWCDGTLDLTSQAEAVVDLIDRAAD